MIILLNPPPRTVSDLEFGQRSQAPKILPNFLSRQSVWVPFFPASFFEGSKNFGAIPFKRCQTVSIVAFSEELFFW